MKFYVIKNEKQYELYICAKKDDKIKQKKIISVIEKDIQKLEGTDEMTSFIYDNDKDEMVRLTSEDFFNRYCVKQEDLKIKNICPSKKVWEILKIFLLRNGKVFNKITKYNIIKYNFDKFLFIYGTKINNDVANEILKKIKEKTSEKSKEKNIYVLRHKNIDVLSFFIKNNKCFITEIYNEKHLPLVLKNYRKEKEILLKEWLISRIIPSTRSKYKKLCQNEEKLKTDEGKIELAIKNKCLSLSDCYWVDEKKEKNKWEDINFFDNNFNDYLSNFLLNVDKDIKKEGKRGSSPSLATGGNLSKAWIIDNNERILLKSGSNYEFGENYIEKVVSDILDYVGIPHIKYWLQSFTKHQFSACKCGCTNNMELIPMAEYQFEFQDWGKDDYDYILDKMSWREEFVKMVFVDYVLCNEDRHWYNFGVLRNADTLEVKNMFPIFDNGMCLYCNNKENIGEILSSAMTGETNNELLKILKDKRFKKIVSDLIPKMEEAINKYITYSNELKENCIRQLNMLKI